MKSFFERLSAFFLHRKQAVGIAAIAIGLVLLGVWGAGQMRTPPKPAPESSSSVAAPVVSIPSSSEPEESGPFWSQDFAYPTDKLFVLDERQNYADKSILLEVPRLELSVPVLGGVDEYTLTQGVGLYDYAQPPGLGNRNVSIAGHRDIYGQEFYYVDTIVEGDLLYLTYQGKKYTYEYDTTRIVEADDWSPIYCTDDSILTLTSCDPIGTSEKRIIVTAKLADIADV